jgi:hypothetical protein
MGGSNDSSNLVELTVEEHAKAHRELYEEHGRIEDKLAWKGLAGLATTAEIVYELLSENRKGDKNPMWGKPAPNRGVKRPGIGGRKKGTTWSADERKSRELARSTEEYKDKMEKVYADADRNKRIGDAHRGKTGSSAGKHWYNNGLDEKYLESAQPGWIKGRLNHTNEARKGLRWYNDGVKDKQYRQGTEPEGFISGRISRKQAGLASIN